MFTSWDQIESWIRDNGFKRWILYKDVTKAEKIIDSGAFTVSDMADKLAMTEKYLRMAGGRAVAHGFATNGVADPTVCEIRLESESTSGVGQQQNIMPLNIGEIEDRIRKQVQAEFREQDYQKRLSDLEKREKAIEEDKNSALGALFHYFAPIGKLLIEKKLMRNVAGIDAEEPVHVQPMHVIKEEQAEAETVEQAEPESHAEAEVFTDEEADALFSLMARFKKVEPDYMKLIEAVVTIAENGDATYSMAKGFLIK